MLPPEAKVHFDNLWSSASSQAWTDLDRVQQEFERKEFSQGHGPGGGGFAARLATLYEDSLSARASAIVDALKTVHASFNSPLDDGVEAQLLDWGARALSGAYQGLEGAYSRHLQQFSIRPMNAIGLDTAYAKAQAAVANLPRRYLWELKNVPSMRPQAAAAPVPSVVINNSGTIGALQTGAGSTANVQQQWVSGDTSELQAALAAFRVALERAHDVDAEQRRELIADVDGAVVELQQDRPNKGKLLRWLGGVGAVVGTVGSIQPAYEAVKAVARLLGLPL